MIRNIKVRTTKFQSHLKKVMVNKIMHSLNGNIENENKT